MAGREAGNSETSVEEDSAGPPIDGPASNGVPTVLRFSSFDPRVVVHGITTRSARMPLSGNMSYMAGDDVDLVRRNRQTWARAIGFDWSRLVLGWQVHETTVALVTEKDAGSGAGGVETSLQRVDGLITQAPGLPIGVMAADCVPILIHDPKNQAVGAVHAGWRGTVDGIAGVAVESLKSNFGSRPEDLSIGMGPSICSACYQVGPEVIDRWSQSGLDVKIDAVDETDEGLYFDLRAANRGQLLEAGVPGDNIEIMGVCTRCSNGSLFSRRGLGPRTGLFASVIMLKAAGTTATLDSSR